MKVYAPSTGIELSIKTDQPALQLYTCNGLNGTLPVKKTQKANKGANVSDMVQQYGCFVLETENYIDGINNPKWGEKYTGILRKGDKYTQHSEYTFGVHR